MVVIQMIERVVHWMIIGAAYAAAMVVGLRAYEAVAAYFEGLF